MEAYDSMIPAPGDPHGPCSGDCPCGRCQRQRGIAQRTCVLCNGRIGYGRAFVEDRFGHCYFHVECARARSDVPAEVREGAGSRGASPFAATSAPPVKIDCAESPQVACQDESPLTAAAVSSAAPVEITDPSVARQYSWTTARNAARRIRKAPPRRSSPFAGHTLSAETILMAIECCAGGAAGESGEVG